MNFPQASRDFFVFKLIVLGTWLALTPEISAEPNGPAVLSLDLVWHPDGSVENGGFWVLKRLPGDGDIAAEDADLKRDLKNAIAALRSADGTSPCAWNLKRRDHCNFSNALARQMQTYPNFQLVPPGDTDHTSRLIGVKVAYDARTAPLVARKPIEISIIVRGSTAIAREPIITTIGNLAAHNIEKLASLDANEAQTRVFIGATDIPPRQAATWADSSDHAHAFRAAAFAFNSAKTHNLAANQPFGVQSQETGALAGAEGPVQGEITNYVNEKFGLPGDWRIVPPQDEKAKMIETKFGPQPWKIRIALQAMEQIEVHIRGSRVEGNFEPREAHPRWAKDFAALERSIEESQRSRFDAIRGRLLTSDDFLAKANEIRTDVELEDKIVNAAVETGERSLKVTADFLPRLTELEAGVGYSSDKQLTGSLSLTSHNLIKDDDQLKLSATAGLEKQAGELSYALPYFTSHDGRSSATLDINGTYGRDNDLLLGDPKFDGFDLEQLSGSIRNTFRFTTERESTESEVTSEFRPSRIYALMVAATAGLADTRLTAPAPLRAKAESGQELFLLLDVQQSLRSKLRPDERPGLGELRLVSNATVKKAFEVGPGDFDFFRANIDVTGRAFFGDKSSRDFVVRLTLGGALVTGHSPIYEEFRIGGDTIMRGMEEGERTARGAFFDTVEFGVALERIWVGGSKTLGFDLKNIYLNLFFDHALITQRGSLNPPDDSERNFETIGVSVEMAIPGDKVAGSLEFGYAWSPQSIHENGRIFTAMHLNF